MTIKVGDKLPDGTLTEMIDAETMLSHLAR
jgi:hypothetical protein